MLAASIVLGLLLAPTLPADDLRPVPQASQGHTCFPKKERKRLEKAGLLERRIAEYARMAEERAKKWEPLAVLGPAHWTQQTSTWLSMDDLLEGPNCLSHTVIGELQEETVPLTKENDRNLGELSRNLSRLAIVLRYAEKNKSFFRHQREVIRLARWQVEDARAVVASQFRKGAHVGIQGP